MSGGVEVELGEEKVVEGEEEENFMGFAAVGGLVVVSVFVMEGGWKGMVVGTVVAVGAGFGAGGVGFAVNAVDAVDAGGAEGADRAGSAFITGAGEGGGTWSVSVVFVAFFFVVEALDFGLGLGVGLGFAAWFVEGVSGSAAGLRAERVVGIVVQVCSKVWRM